jgi:hypothetical protein
LTFDTVLTTLSRVRHGDTVTAATTPERRRRWRELALVVLGYSTLTVCLTAPLGFHLGSVARIDNADTRMLIWNVAWVARTLVVDPVHVFDANIFYPHRGTLAYSETNLGAGILAIPVYWATRNPVAAHNFVVLLSFVLSAAATYYLVRYLVADWRAAAVAAICFAYCPYVFSHLPHVHLLMTAGFPAAMLAFHRLADRPSAARGAVLGLVMAAEALFCGYYVVFVGLTVGFAVVVVAAARARWMDKQYWSAVASAAIVAAACALPLFLPYLRLERTNGFTRAIDASQFSADWRAYLASSAYAHSWMLPRIGHWNEVLFPGLVALVAGVAGLRTAWVRRGRLREIAILYGGLLVLALWASFGPAAGLYRVLNATFPAFSLMRAPSRFGVLVAFSLSVLAGVSIVALLGRLERPGDRATDRAADRAASNRHRTPLFAAAALAAVAVLELEVPLAFSPVPPTEPAYRVLATLRRGAIIELPFYSTRFASERTRYMLNSTAHWMPLVNAFSSYIPPDLFAKTDSLSQFPTADALKMLEGDGVRYAVVHLNLFSPEARDDVIARIDEFQEYLARRYADDHVRIYEIVGAPR